MKTNAVRLLDTRQIPYELRSYEVDPSDLTAESVAAKIGLPPEQVFKTLVVKGASGTVYVAAVPGNSELNVKELARMAGERKMELVPLKDVQPLTGYIRGGVTALACKREYPVFLDESASRFEVISISAGIRGTQILLSPDDFVALTHAQLAAISAEKG